MFDKTMVRGLLAAVLAASAAAVRADVLNMPTGETSLEMVIVGDPGNAADTRTASQGGTPGCGAVGYTYRIGEYDVTVAQYCQFLNAVAATDTYALYDYSIGSVNGINRTGGSGAYVYSISSGKANYPVRVCWADAARFCNWLDNGQPTGPEGNSTTETGAYTINGGTTNAALMAVTRNAGAGYFLPTEDEWYKAAYYMGGGTNAGYWTYTTRSDMPPSNVLSATGTNNANYYNGRTYTDPINYLTPVGAFAGSPGPYGTYDMGGDYDQWNETPLDGVYRGLRGGDCIDGVDLLAASEYITGGACEPIAGNFAFRVAEVPEPGSIILLLAGGVCFVAFACRRR